MLTHRKPDIPFMLAEIRIACLMIGLVECAWSFLGLFPDSRSLFSTVINEAGLGIEWFGFMFCNGVLLSAGAIFPWRSMRHIGLFLSALAWLTLCGVFLNAGVLTPVTVTMPIFGVFALGLIYADAKRKPRRNEKLI